MNTPTRQLDACMLFALGRQPEARPLALPCHTGSPAFPSLRCTPLLQLAEAGDKLVVVDFYATW